MQTNISGEQLKIGDWVDWLHGDCHRVAKIIGFSNDGKKVLLSGMLRPYWMKKETLIININRPYPMGGMAFNTYG